MKDDKIKPEKIKLVNKLFRKRGGLTKEGYDAWLENEVKIKYNEKDYENKLQDPAFKQLWDKWSKSRFPELSLIEFFFVFGDE